jgi:hypothetical protein
MVSTVLSTNATTQSLDGKYIFAGIILLFFICICIYQRYNSEDIFIFIRICDRNCDSDPEDRYYDPKCKNCNKIKKIIDKKANEKKAKENRVTTRSMSRRYAKYLREQEEREYTGCFGPNSSVRMSDGSFKEIHNIKRNDKVWTPNGIANVEFSITLGSNLPNQHMCKLNNTWITPYHPMLINNIWVFPTTITPPIMMQMPIVHNLVLDIGHIIEVNGVLCCTLGHGIKGNVIEHDFFGNKNKIINSMVNQPGFEEGSPIFKNVIAIRDNNGLVINWVDNI